MSLRTNPEPLYLELEVSCAFYDDLLTEPTDYGRPIEIESLGVTPAPQDTVKVLGRNISTKGNTLLSVTNPTGEATRIELRAIAYECAVVARLGIDVLYIRDRHQDAFERLRHLFDGIRSPEARRRHHHVDHRHGNLWLLLSWN
jgi:hypothetical protein